MKYLMMALVPSGLIIAAYVKYHRQFEMVFETISDTLGVIQ